MQPNRNESFSEMIGFNNNKNNRNVNIADAGTPLIQGDNNGDGDEFEALVEQQEHVVKNKLGTINGCYVPCLLNIMGIVLFERLGWGVGQVSMSGVFFIFFVAEFQAILTVLSLSAIVTNGSMRGGGSYYMISRTLGPEFGGSIGMLFYAAYCVGVAFYCTGFAEEVVDTWYPDADNSKWLTVAFASGILALCLGVALAGAGWFTKINVFLFTIQFAGIFLALIATYARGTFHLAGQDTYVEDTTVEYEHLAWTWKQFKKNANTDCSTHYSGSSAVSSIDCYTLEGVFGVLFPAATGIMEGANLSGDLANPAKSIPRGTISAVITSIIVYFFLICGFAGAYNSAVLITDTTIMQETAWGDFGKYLVISGILISASSSALGSLFGGSRVLQAVARDKLFPGIGFLGYGSKKGDEPRIAVLVTWAIAQCITLIGSINAIAPISTAFFCLSYATVNLACFLLEVSGTPNFRPQFKYYTWHTCLIGLISNLIVMFYVDYKFGTGALICEILVFVFLAWRAPKNVWGDVTQSVIFHQVRKYLLRLDERKMHSKLWRPSILLLVDTEDLALIDFCNNLKKGGLYVCGTVLNGEFDQFAEMTLQIRREWIDFIDRNQIKAFPQISIAPTPRIGYENLLLLSGLGAMQPNTVVIPLLKLKRKQKSPRKGKQKLDQNKNEIDNDSDDEPTEALEQVSKEKQDGRRVSIFGGVPQHLRKLVVDSPANMDTLEYMQLLKNILKVNKNIIITSNFEHLDYELVVSAALKSKSKTVGSFHENISINSSKPVNQNDDEEEMKKNESLQSHQTISQGQIAVQSLADDKLQLSLNTSIQSTARRRSSWGSYFTFKHVARPQIASQWVDVWLFSRDYTFDLTQNNMDSGFPMLLMQLAHILLLNKVWERAAGLRVMLVVPTTWTTEDQLHFDSQVTELRLEIDDVVVFKEPDIGLPTWDEILSGRKRRADMRKYYKALNQSMTSISSQTYFSFMKLPPFPPQGRDDSTNLKLIQTYFESLYILIHGMPPSALVVTGEEIPVISVDI